MGRIKTGLIKRVTFDLISLHRQKFTQDFAQNKTVVNTVLDRPNKKLRNAIAGYITRLMKHQETA